MSQYPIIARTRPSPAAQVILALMVAAMLAGCGKKGPPVPPPGEPSTYPQPYPKQ
ncbi:MAG TPA: lipoprotein [Stellaceae bacterium]|jgi:predicted small lipoprotein YifL|nr:lipoprotein [Stellaceae bacterium]